MELSKEEEEILEGKQGVAKQKAMEILVALGNIYGAENLIPVASVQVSGVSYKNLGDAGFEFLQEWADSGAITQVLTTLNPAGMDLEQWESMGFSPSFAQKQLCVISCFSRFGIPPLCSCTPYLVGNLPLLGQHIAWAESSAVSFANSVLGARTNREGGPSALAAAIIGKTANYGFHLERNRKANYLIQVKCLLKDEADFGALGYLVGKKIGSSIPYFKGIPEFPSMEKLKALGAAMAASGSVALYHIENITPEAKMQNMLLENHETMQILSLQEGYEKLNSSCKDIDMVSLGCPHASWEEIRQVASYLEGKKLKSRLWITTASPLAAFARRSGLEKKIQNAGGFIVGDTCMIVSPIQDLGVRSLATNSAKAACYAPSHCNVNVRYGNLKQCLDAAIEGSFSE
ncbi:MAG: aconitase X catalytic domain-containing protein [Candidatus Brocadiae bacterium]|nr:aconitase X catalytic domain-containing protein [Candidatus Brocadiia bacterium]